MISVLEGTEDVGKGENVEYKMNVAQMIFSILDRV